MIFNKLDYIHKTPTPLSKKYLKPVFEFKKNNKDCVMTREQRLELDAGNKFYKNQLVKQSSHYNLGQWNKDFQKSQNFKKIICEFPCIDFHKTQRSYIGDGSFYGENKNAKYNNVNLNIQYNAFDKIQFRRINPVAIKNNNTETKVEAINDKNNEDLKSEKEKDEAIKDNINEDIKSEKKKENEISKDTIENEKKNDLKNEDFILDSKNYANKDDDNKLINNIKNILFDEDNLDEFPEDYDENFNDLYSIINKMNFGNVLVCVEGLFTPEGKTYKKYKDKFDKSYERAFFKKGNSFSNSNNKPKKIIEVASSNAKTNSSSSKKKNIVMSNLIYNDFNIVKELNVN